MKKMIWLFIILVLLNIAVFLYLSLVSTRLTAATSTETQTEKNADWLSFDTPVVSDLIDISEPEILNNSEPEIVSTPSVSQVEVVTASKEEIKEEIVAEKEQEPEKKWCLGNITLKEDDYSALKSKLSSIPHQTKKIETVEKVEKKSKDSLVYWVHLPANSDSLEQQKQLKNQGFEPRIVGSQIYIGSSKDANTAVTLKQKAFNAGFTQATITERAISGQTTVEEKTITTHKISFLPMTEKQAKSAQRQLKIKVKVTAKACEK